MRSVRGAPSCTTGSHVPGWVPPFVLRDTGKNITLREVVFPPSDRMDAPVALRPLCLCSLPCRLHFDGTYSEEAFEWSVARLLPCPRSSDRSHYVHDVLTTIRAGVGARSPLVENTIVPGSIMSARSSSRPRSILRCRAAILMKCPDLKGRVAGFGDNKM